MGVGQTDGGRRKRMVAVLAVILVLLAAGAWMLRGLVWQEGDGAGRTLTRLEAAIAEVEAGRRTTPLIGETTDGSEYPVTFLAQGVDGQPPRIVSDVTGWGEHADGTFDFAVGAMTRVGQTEWYSLETRVAPGARIEYQVAYGLTDRRLDPNNPRRLGQPAPASEFVTPGYQPPEELTDPPVSPAGRLVETIMNSRVLHQRRRLIVYTPSGYRDEGDYPMAVFLDLRASQVSRVIDWLIARRAIDPLVAVFEGPVATGGDRPADEQMRAFLTGELPAWVASRYEVSPSAGKRAVIALSFGAKDALDAALDRTGAYDSVGVLIPGRRISRADIEAMARSGARPLRVAILAGRYDHANIATARDLRQALAAAGHAVDYTEVPEGHSPRTWLYHLRTVLVSLFGSGSQATTSGSIGTS